MSCLGELDNALTSAIAVDDPQLNAMAHHLLRKGGKRLRPALLFLAAEFGSFDRERLVAGATAIELLHVASLYHDDVIDRAPARRQEASVNARWGNAGATLCGTYLFSRAIALLATLGHAATRAASNAISDVCAGQLQEVENVYNTALPEADHLLILERKTGAFFGLPCQLGVELSDAENDVREAFARYAHHLGLAFQLRDDALDLVGDARQLGKATGTDLREGVYSLPVLRTLARRDNVGARVRAVLEQLILSDADIAEVVALVVETSAAEDALDLARAHGHAAQAALVLLPAGPARNSLTHLAQFATSRAA